MLKNGSEAMKSGPLYWLYTVGGPIKGVRMLSVEFRFFGNVNLKMRVLSVKLEYKQSILYHLKVECRG